jgi:hypothetical protein
MLKTFKKIQLKVFGDTTGGVGQHVRWMIKHNFVGKDVPYSFLYYPTAMGGLGPENPFTDLYPVRDNSIKNPERLVDDFLEAEKSEFETKSKSLRN